MVKPGIAMTPPLMSDSRSKMPVRRSRWLLFALCLTASGALADTLPLPTGLTDFSSHDGEQFLLESKALEAYFPLSIHLVTQKTQAYCGVASMVMVLNALNVPAPSTPDFQPYRTFTQDNVLDESTDAVLPREVLARQGMTLDQLGALLVLHPVAADVHHAADGGLDAFRAAASAALETNDHFVIVNYQRKILGQLTGGHISPLAAYDEKTDRFLILDVARYKYPPVWVKASDLFDAMNTTDPSNGGKTRGFVVVGKIEAAPTAAPAK
jgi:Phytochelatin synthase